MEPVHPGRLPDTARGLRLERGGAEPDLEIHNRTGRRWAAHRANALAVLLGVAWLGAAGCGDDSRSDGGRNVPAAGGVHEMFVANNPDVALTLEHTVLLHLEARGGHPGDTHTLEGADMIPYFFDRPINLTLVTNAKFEGSHIQSTDLSGAVFAGATFDSGSNLGGTSFAGSDLSSARFSGSDLKKIGEIFPEPINVSVR